MDNETGIPCWMCNKRSGIDCPGRQENESTLCDPCLHIHSSEILLEQDRHLLKLLNEKRISLEQFWEFIGLEEGEKVIELPVRRGSVWDHIKEKSKK